MLSHEYEGEIAASFRECVNGSHTVPIADYSIKRGIEGVLGLGSSSEGAVMLEREDKHW